MQLAELGGARMSNEDQIRGLFKTFERALDTSDVALAAGCYMKDAVAMGAGFPTLAGSEMPSVYVQLFKDVQMNVAFTIDELVVASDTVAYALSRSNGTQRVRESGVEHPESNREMFIFGREDGLWKIARYMFNKSE
jgi:ketosteroid isomerase-like protein